MSTHTGVCNFCGTGCGHLLQVEDGAVRGVFASPGHPVSRGTTLRARLAHPRAAGDRGPDHAAALRGGGRLEAVSWDEALDAGRGRAVPLFAATRSASWPRPAPRTKTISPWPGWPGAFFARPISISSPTRVTTPPPTSFSRATGLPAMLGVPDRDPPGRSDSRRRDGHRPAESDRRERDPLRRPRRRRPRHPEQPDDPDRQAQPARISGRTPGTLRHVLAAMPKILVERGLDGQDFLAEPDRGVRGLREPSLTALDLQALTAAAGLTLGRVEDLARRLSGARSAMAFFSSGIAGLDRDTVALLYDLFLAAGKIGRPGCGVIPVIGISNMVGSNDMGAVPPFAPGLQARPRAERRVTRPGSSSARSPPRSRPLVVADHDEEIVLQADADQGASNSSSTSAPSAIRSRIWPTSSCRRPPTPRRTAPIRTPSGGSSSTAQGRAALRGAGPPGGSYADLAGKLGAAWAYASAEDVMTEIAASVPAYAGVTYPKLETGFGLAVAVRRRPPGRHDPAAGRGRAAPAQVRLGRPRISPSRPTSEDFPFLLMAGKSYYYWHQNNIMKKTLHPAPGVQRPASSLPSRGWSRSRPRRRRPARPPRQAAGQGRFGRRVDARRRPGVRRRPARHGLRALLHRADGEGFLKPEAGRSTSAARTPSSPSGSRRCDHVHPAQVRRPGSPPALADGYELYGPSSIRSPARRSVRPGRRPGGHPAGRAHPRQHAQVRRLPPVRADLVLPLRPGQPKGRASSGTTSSGPRPWSASGPAT